jgi:toxin ParE1/3/4
LKRVVLPAARADIVRQVIYFSENGQEFVAERFLAATQAAIAALCHTPNAGPPRPMRNPRLAGLRTWSVYGFDDIKVYYLVGNDEVRIVRILHGRRDIDRILER